LPDLVRQRRTPWFVLAMIAVFPLVGDEHPVPAQNRVRREQRADFFQSLASQDHALHRQTTSLVVIQQDAFLAEFLF
jgi:hypothetical protein